jgi:tetraacyldisaccharide 4'-kinase
LAKKELLPYQQLLHDKPETDAIILDDAFQHRSIKPGFNILLTECSDLYTRDFFLPTGDLRDQRASSKRAKCHSYYKMSCRHNRRAAEQVINEIKTLHHQKVFFTTIEYGTPYHIITKGERLIATEDEILLVCGIANPAPLKDYLMQQSKTYIKCLFLIIIYLLYDDLNDV